MIDNGQATVRFIQVEMKQAGQRIDNFLLKHLKGVPRPKIYRIIRKGEVRVNKKRIRPSYRLVSGDSIRLPPLQLNAVKMPTPSKQVAALVRSRILYEDERLLVANKPSKLAVHGGTGVHYGLIDVWCHLRYPDPLFLVHRLDRQASGCILIAKDREASCLLQNAIRTAQIDKSYLTLLKGCWEKADPLEVNMPLIRDKTDKADKNQDRYPVRVDPQGKPALSFFHPVYKYKHFSDCTACTLMKVKIVTGRMHQIRVHAKALGYPLAGDDQYGDRVFNRAMRNQGLSRLFLHAHSLQFPHPDDGRSIHITSPLDSDLVRVLENIATATGDTLSPAELELG